MTKESTLKLLSELTMSNRMGRRSKILLRDPENPQKSNWFMFLPKVFNDALDIKFNLGVNQGWSQAGCFSFKQSDMIYDTPQAYQLWSEALKHINLAVSIQMASSAGAGNSESISEVNERYCGTVDFIVYLPSKDRTRLVDAMSWRLTQDEFVAFLIAGPSGQFKDAIDNAMLMNV